MKRINFRSKRSYLGLLLAAIMLLVSSTAWSKSRGDIKLIAYPNPFDADTQVLKIKRHTSAGPVNFSASVKVQIFNYAGKKVFSKKFRGRVKWSGYDSQGNQLGPGVYFVKMLFEFDDGGVNIQWYRVAIK